MKLHCAPTIFSTTLSSSSYSSILVLFVFLLFIALSSSSSSSSHHHSSSFVSCQQSEKGEQESIEKHREKTEKEILVRARLYVGEPIEKVRPHRLLNYVLNPDKDWDRFPIEQHARMPENELGLFVIDKKGKHGGIYASDKGTIIHASPRARKVVEEPFAEAKKSFPNGWSRKGPAGKMKKSYAFSKPLEEIVKEAQMETDKKP